VRRAISLAMDREEYIRIFSAGRGRFAPAGAEMEIFTQEEARQLLRYDSEGIAFYFGPEYIFWQGHLKNFSPNKGNRGRLSPEAWLEK